MFEKRLSEIKDLKRKIQQAKLEKGETLGDLNDWGERHTRQNQHIRGLSNRNSHPEVFSKKGVLKNFIKLTGERLCQSLFFNKVACLEPATLLKKRLWHRCFPVNFVTFLRTPFFIEHLWWLLIKDELEAALEKL